jgi:hypothetical protein
MRVIGFGRGGDMVLNKAQISTGKKTFNGAGGNAGFNPGLFAVDPTIVTQGDWWFNSTAQLFKSFQNGSVRFIPAFLDVSFEADEVTKYEFGYLRTSDFISSTTTKTLGRSTNVANTQMLTVNGISSNIDLEILAKGQGFIIPASPVKGIITTQQSGGGFFYALWVNPTNTITYQAEHPIAASGSSVGGFAQNLALPSGIPNNSTVCFEIDVLGITAATGATGYYLKYLFAFRKDNSGVFTQIGAITTVIAVADLPYVPGAPTFSILGSTLTANINFTGALAARRYTISLKLITGQ